MEKKQHLYKGHARYKLLFSREYQLQTKLYFFMANLKWIHFSAIMLFFVKIIIQFPSKTSFSLGKKILNEKKK